MYIEFDLLTLGKPAYVKPPISYTVELYNTIM